ncbi:MAG: 1,4-dihydroxy-2-naphthoate octaprenyltransferase [Bacteroidales bacterium]|nr:1,4-dihydroxy-2-naphthoate octaprenyltransferase [Bacteroidales bacterium]
MSIKPYITSLRLRTLPLSVAGVVLGAALSELPLHWDVFLLTVVTTLCLQIITNLSNELGDAQKGTDQTQGNRQQYSLQSGAITIQQMQIYIVVFVVLSMIFGTLLIYTTFGTLCCRQSGVFLALGALAIAAAIKYTLGHHAYGYHGLGDLGVFLFFGLLGVLGSFYMQCQTLTWRALFAAVAIALPIVAVLNLNNIRDMEGDICHGKHTLASKLGMRGAKIYQTLLVLVPFLVFPFVRCYATFIFLPFFVWHVVYLWHHTGAELDRHMKLLSLSILGMAIAQLIIKLIA